MCVGGGGGGVVLRIAVRFDLRHVWSQLLTAPRDTGPDSGIRWFGAKTVIGNELHFIYGP